MPKKIIALMDRYGKNFTEGDNFKIYAGGFLERDCDVFQLDPYSIDFRNSLGITHRLKGNSSNFQRQNQGYIKDINGFDVIFDLSDIVDLEFAEKLSKIDTLHINSPLATYNSADKRTYVNKYPEFIPKTIVSSNISELEEALHSVFDGVMVVKDPFGCCGRGVEKIETKGPNYRKTLEKLTNSGKKEIVAQKFMHFALEGGKRVAVVGDIKNPNSYEIIHFYGRVPSLGNWKDNLPQGGKVIDVDNLRDDEKELCLKVASKSGLYAVGLDIMDDLDKKGNRVSRLIETNSVLAFAAFGKYSEKLKLVPNFILDRLIK